MKKEDNMKNLPGRFPKFSENFKTSFIFSKIIKFTEKKICRVDSQKFIFKHFEKMHINKL